MAVVTDPKIIDQLNSMENSGSAAPNNIVTDPNIIAKLDEMESGKTEQKDSDNNIFNNTGVVGKAVGMIPDIMQGFNNPSRAFSNRAQALGRGFTDVGEGIKQAFLQGSEALGFTPKGSTQQYTRQKDAERNFYNQSPAGQDKFSDLLRSGASQSPMAALGTILGSEAPLIQKALSSGGANALIGSSQYVPEGDSRKRNAVTYGALGATAPLVEPILGDVIPRIGNELTPSRLAARIIGSPLSEEELLRNLEASSGTQTGLGNVIGSPMLQRTQENILAKIPFSGANQSLQNTGAEIANRGNNLVENYRRDISPEEIPDRLGNALKEAYKGHQSLKNNLYKKRDKLAEQLGFKPELEDFSRAANMHAKTLENSELLQHEPEYKSLLNKLQNYREPYTETTTRGRIVNKEGDPIINETKTSYPTLEEAQQLKSKLYEMGNKSMSSSSGTDRSRGRVFYNLSRALGRDIDRSLDNFGSEELINAHNEANKNFKKNYSPFLDKQIYKYTEKEEHPETLVSNFIKTGKGTDRANHLNKLMNRLSLEDQDLVRYSYFSRALDGDDINKSINPNKLKSLWNNLGRRQKNALVPNELERRNLDNFVRLTNMNQKAVNMMWNPSTGQINSDLFSLFSLKNPALIPAGRVANNALTSENLRNRLVEQLRDINRN